MIHDVDSWWLVSLTIDVAEARLDSRSNKSRRFVSPLDDRRIRVRETGVIAEHSFNLSQRGKR